MSANRTCIVDGVVYESEPSIIEFCCTGCAGFGSHLCSKLDICFGIIWVKQPTLDLDAMCESARQRIAEWVEDAATAEKAIIRVGFSGAIQESNRRHSYAMFGVRRRIVCGVNE